MNKKILFIFIVTINSLFAVEKITEYFLDGVIKSTIEYQNGTHTNISMGIKEGLEKIYYNTGDLAYQVNNIDNKRDGKMSWYDREKNLLETIHFKEGKRHGKNSVYYANGKLRIELTYIDDKKEGKERFYFSTGELASIVNYINGKKEGIQKEYNQDGLLNNEVMYKNNYKEGERVWYDKKMNIIQKELYKMDRPINLMKKVQNKKSTKLIDALQGLNFNPNDRKVK